MYTNLPFVYFLAAMAMVYIANAHYAEKTMREMHHLKDTLKEARWKCLTAEAEVMHKSTRSEVARSVSHLGLQFGEAAPEAIVVESHKSGTYE